MNDVLRDVRRSRAALGAVTKLRAEGFRVLRAWNNRHIMLRVAHGETEMTLTISSSPKVEHEAIENTVKQARRNLRRLQA